MILQSISESILEIRIMYKKKDKKKRQVKLQNNIAVMINKKTTDHLALTAQVASSSIKY